jgi:aryl-alcohol dehydrogenase-like predicted oxidoreductase
MRAARSKTFAERRVAELGLDLSAMTGTRRPGDTAQDALNAAVRGGVRLFANAGRLTAPANHLGVRHVICADVVVSSREDRIADGSDVTLMLAGSAALADRARWSEALALRDRGACERAGILVEPGGDARGLAKRFKPAVMQIACSVLDQRAIHSGALEAIASMGIEIQLRTSVMRGLLFLPREALPAALSEAGPRVSRIRRMIAEAGADPLQAALAFALHRPEASAVIVPAGSVGEVRALLAASAAPLPDLDWPALALDHGAALDAEAELHRRVAA